VKELIDEFKRLWPYLNERGRRMLAATKAVGLGYGGVSKVARACGLSRVTISHGIAELSEPAMANERVRRQGAGRPAVELKNPRIIQVLDDLVEPMTRGDPESPLRWTCKSTRILATELSDRKHPVSHAKVAQLLQSMNYSLQGNRKTEEGEDHPDRDAQFQHINRQVKRAMRQGQPVISVDTKKKELVGNYSNSGKEWRPVGEVRKVKGHDFPDPEVPRAYPYGIYDIQHNTGFVNVGR
jgi:Rhodopirellula transposase DDE domain